MTTQHPDFLMEVKNGLRKAPKVCIKHQLPGEKANIVDKGISKPLLASMTGVSDIALDNPTGSVTISQQSLFGVKGALRWLKACGYAGYVVDWWTPFPHTFSQLGQVYLAADYLRIWDLTEMLEKILEARAKAQVHSECVAAIYKNIKQPHILKAIASKSIADAIFEERIKHESKYWELCRNSAFKEFKEDLKREIEMKEEDWRKTSEGFDWLETEVENPRTLWEVKEERYLMQS